MRKLKLEIESLRVHSFITSGGRTPVRGTVRGHLGTDYDTFLCTAPSTYEPTDDTTTSGTWTDVGCYPEPEVVTM